MFEDAYVTVEAQEKFIDQLAQSEALCNDKLRLGVCSKSSCQYCEKKMRLDECKKCLDSFSLLVLGDKVEARTNALRQAHPTPEEIEDKRKRMREAELRGLKQGYKELNHDSFWYGGGIIGVIFFILTLIVVPLVGLSEWFV